ncbi:hypothetical protein TSARBOMBA_180 [Bacillus phage TsarBomba]|uniref:Uncharacterized protein n=1 Tax=Bacillus phage TsarBomba TaxID=1690456 RepID=A0A0K2D0G6_9CAUD|nr:hypothetical protein TSARBOMBA_180 [Bacillus phage TsarBomba]ALA13213.1 hypothetical protein TSARBOMBA_180 [Bacillus phage TsarBomba]
MPSALTGEIYDNENNSARDYLIRCSKSFGALIHMRDLGLDFNAPPRLYHLDLTSYDRDIEEAKKKIEYYKNMSVEDVEQQIEDDYTYMKQRQETYNEEDVEIIERYDKVLKEVQAWEVPESLTNLKEYAVNHLLEQIQYQSGVLNRRNERKEEEVPGQMIHHEVWRSERVEWAQDELKRAEESKERAIKAVEEKNAWITDLLNALESVK